MGNVTWDDLEGGNRGEGLVERELEERVTHSAVNDLEEEGRLKRVLLVVRVQTMMNPCRYCQGGEEREDAE